jgi:hypothetical protein
VYSLSDTRYRVRTRLSRSGARSLLRADTRALGVHGTPTVRAGTPIGPRATPRGPHRQPFHAICRLRAFARAVPKPACEQGFPADSGSAHLCLKIVVSPVRVRVRPHPAWGLDYLVPGATSCGAVEHTTRIVFSLVRVEASPSRKYPQIWAFCSNNSDRGVHTRGSRGPFGPFQRRRRWAGEHLQGMKSPRQSAKVDPVVDRLAHEGRLRPAELDLRAVLARRGAMRGAVTDAGSRAVQEQRGERG